MSVSHAKHPAWPRFLPRFARETIGSCHRGAAPDQQEG